MTATGVSPAEGATDDTRWKLTLLEDVELPFWFSVPLDDDPDAVAAWTARVTEAVTDLLPAGSGEAVTGELGYALAATAEPGSLALFSVWPVTHPISLVCGVQLVAGSFRPDPSDYRRFVVHEAEGTHLGPGLQYTVERQVSDGIETMDLVSVSYVFSDGDVSLVFTLSEAPAALIERALFELTVLKDSLCLQSEDGTRFRAVSDPDQTSDAAAWPLEDGDQ